MKHKRGISYGLFHCTSVISFEGNLKLGREYPFRLQSRILSLTFLHWRRQEINLWKRLYVRCDTRDSLEFMYRIRLFYYTKYYGNLIKAVRNNIFDTVFDLLFSSSSRAYMKNHRRNLLLSYFHQNSNITSSCKYSKNK